MVLECVEHILTQDTIPGAAELTCGNYKYFDLQGAKDFIGKVIIPNFTSEEFSSEYPYCQE
jgi:S-ribosylhomocysteine lyase LuxS involved in autoinducer biosynthesis